VNLLLAYLLNGWRVDTSMGVLPDDYGHLWVPIVARHPPHHFIPLGLRDPVPFRPADAR
jgi:hypothetical protein